MIVRKKPQLIVKNSFSSEEDNVILANAADFVHQLVFLSKCIASLCLIVLSLGAKLSIVL